MAVYCVINNVSVVGAGLWGSAAAYHLSLHSENKVCLIGPSEPSKREIPKRTIFGAHYDEARITRQNIGSIVEAQIAKKSLEGSRVLTEKTGISFYTESSNVNFGPQGSQYVAKSKRTSELLGLNHRLLGNAQLSQLFPYLRTGEHNQSVVQLTGCGMINPRKQVLAQKTAADLQGCHIVNDIVVQIQAIHNDPSETCTILQLRTESGQIFHSRKVLLCSGGFTHFKSLLPAGVQLDLRLAPTQTLRIELSGVDVSKLWNMPTVCSMTRGNNQADCYICPPVVYPDGKIYLKIGHGRLKYFDSPEEVINWYRGNGDPEVTKTLTEMINTYVPGLKPLSTQTDTCVVTATRSGMPYIDMITPEIGIAVGGNGVGARLAYEIGRIAAKMIVKGHWDHDLPADIFKVHLNKQTCKL